MNQKIKGSCHCASAELELFLTNGFDLRRCNCSICSRKGAIVSSVLFDDLTILRGKDFNDFTIKDVHLSRNLQ